ncbi:PAS domain-containing sensor histidine kinase [Pontibacter ruber]|uniref:histidine kinase n=1 Tax=Pontibacter ruber TaxID=1343895 RepID=A0ABW5CYQ4_9BACT|nr:PAS domain-containing sensor histidine kinase [Pontibacter ruber]
MDESTNYEVFKNLIRRTSKVLFSYDLESASITFLSPAFSYIWNRTRESVLANPAILVDTIHPDDRAFLAKEYDEMLKGIIKHEIEFRIILPDRSVKWVLLTPQLVTDKQGRWFIAGLVDDITSQKDNIRNLQKFAAKKNSILEILSHDLAGPIANVGALATELAESTKGYANEEVNNIIRLIKESSERSVRLIRDFVQQEFIESVNSGMMKKRMNLVDKVLEVVEQYKEGERFIKKDIDFSFSNEKIYVHIDQDKFMQVLNNLISNAIKFTPDHGKISIDLKDKGETVLITVQDNGIGIPKRYHDRLFEKFTPARREGLRGEPSTGLGMSIIKTIVEWHDGRIWFESEENKGSTFFIEIPKE